MTKADFEGIEHGDFISINGMPRVFDRIEVTPYSIILICLESKWYDLEVIKSLAVLTGKLSPWSSPFVPDDALWCVQNKEWGIITFYSKEEKRQVKGYQQSSDLFIVTKRPSWRLKNV